MSTIPSLKEIFDNNTDCYADTGRFENDGSYHEGDTIPAMTYAAFEKCYQLATDGREELEKENGELKRDKVYWQLEAQAKHNANEQLRKELLKANNSYDEQFNQITALQSQCTEKDQEIERLKGLIEKMFIEKERLVFPLSNDWNEKLQKFKTENNL